MNKGYMIFTLDIKDVAGMREYLKEARATITEDIKLLAVDSPEVAEGKWHGTVTVIMEFESIDAARAWYRSPAYQKASEIRHAASDAKAAILDGFDAQAYANSSQEDVVALIGDRF
jgi:uncharacterized protein (DUF1330 family)